MLEVGPTPRGLGLGGQAVVGVPCARSSFPYGCPGGAEWGAFARGRTYRCHWRVGLEGAEHNHPHPSLHLIRSYGKLPCLWPFISTI